jgi:CheY-like chemotaxis protein
MKPRILLVDDSDINLKVMDKLLQGDYELACARSGEECLAQLPAFEPDLVLLDVMMPGIGGYETCRRIKSSPLGPLTQVVLVSARASKAERQQACEMGSDDYIIKPFDHEEFREKVRGQLKLRGARDGLVAGGVR